jgi:ABC-type nitrate/sulfonate/bicarbonate transport system substrate-binding protein
VKKLKGEFLNMRKKIGLSGLFNCSIFSLHRQNKKVHRMLGAALSALLAFGLVSPGHADNVKIRVGLTTSTSLPPVALYYAIKTGAFKKEGLDVEVKSFIQSNQKNDSMKAGGLDIDLDMSAITAAQLYSAGVPIVVMRAISPADIWAVVAKKDSPLSKPQDFKGKKFGVAALSGTNFGVTYFAFKTENVDLMRDVKVSALPPAGIITALEKGDLDGATLYEPFVSQALNTGRIKILFRPGDMYEKYYKEPFVALVTVTRKEFYDQNKAAMAKFVSVMEKSLASLDANLDVAAEAVVAGMPELKATPAEIKQIMKPYVKGYIKESNDPAFVQKIQSYYDRLYEVKQLAKPVKAADFWVKP